MAAASRWALWCVLLPLVAAADIPSPERDACGAAEPGTPCTYVGPNGPVAGQCVPHTCRTPGAYGTEYACTYCAAVPGAAPAPVPGSPPAGEFTATGAHIDAASEPPERGLPTLLIGITVLAAGVLILVLRKRG